MSKHPVAKAEVSSWPIIGYCAKATGILWVKRESKTARPTPSRRWSNCSKMATPFWSTRRHDPHRTSHPKLPNGGIPVGGSLGVAVVPMAIEYQDKGDAWVGNDTLSRIL
ncbi:MAG: hypothetical protein R2788_02030 [Saprospiraceae bacterium]